MTLALGREDMRLPCMRCHNCGKEKHQPTWSPRGSDCPSCDAFMEAIEPCPTCTADLPAVFIGGITVSIVKQTDGQLILRLPERQAAHFDVPQLWTKEAINGETVDKGNRVAELAEALQVDASMEWPELLERVRTMMDGMRQASKMLEEADQELGQKLCRVRKMATAAERLFGQYHSLIGHSLIGRTELARIRGLVATIDEQVAELLGVDVSEETTVRTSTPNSRHFQLAHALEIATFAFRFSEIQRATRHPDGRPESNATHTMMLMMLVLEVAGSMGLDQFAAAAEAMVHDLPELGPKGDVSTARPLTEEQQAEKRESEQLGIEQLIRGLGSDSGIVRAIHEYEEQRTLEAQLVRLLDKVLPPLSHLLNDGFALRQIGMSLDEMKDKHARVQRELRESYPDPVFERAHALLREAHDVCEDSLHLAVRNDLQRIGHPTFIKAIFDRYGTRVGIASVPELEAGEIRSIEVLDAVGRPGPIFVLRRRRAGDYELFKKFQSIEEAGMVLLPSARRRSNASDIAMERLLNEKHTTTLAGEITDRHVVVVRARDDSHAMTHTLKAKILRRVEPHGLFAAESTWGPQLGWHAKIIEGPMKGLNARVTSNHIMQIHNEVEGE